MLQRTRLNTQKQAKKRSENNKYEPKTLYLRSLECSGGFG